MRVRALPSEGRLRFKFDPDQSRASHTMIAGPP